MRWKISRKSACHTCLWWSHGGENIKWRLENTGSKVQGICPRDTGIFREYVGPRDLLRWYVPELFEGMCSGDMSQRYVAWIPVYSGNMLVPGFIAVICPRVIWRDVSQGYVPGLCCKDMSLGYVARICPRDMFQRYVSGTTIPGLAQSWQVLEV